MAKKIILIFLAAIVVLLPAITAAVIYFMPDDVVQTPLNISGTFYDGGSVSFDFSRMKNSLLASFFDELYDMSDPSPLSPEDINCDKIFYATFTKKDTAHNITLYLSADRYCYFSNDRGELYTIKTGHVNTLLSSSFAISLYEDIHTPTLTTHSNVLVLPVSTSFKYTVKDGSSVNGAGVPTTGKDTVYYSSNTAKFTFSPRPDICNLKVYVGDKLTYDGAYYNFNESSLPDDATIRYEIEATWVKSTENDCFGTANYSFWISHAPAPSFSVQSTQLNAGEFLIVRASNILDTSMIDCTFSEGLAITPRFFKNGESYYALVPLSYELKSGTYKLALECGETKSAFDINVTERNQITQKVDGGASSALTDAALRDMEMLISSIGNKCSNEIFPQQSFINFEESFSIRLGFAHLREFSDGTQYFLNGVDFYSVEGYDIPVINSGVVCASGEDAILGKFVVVDHGYGLKSWYCNISESALSVGNRVEKGDIIAKTGSSNFFSQSGFYLMTTVLDTPVAPYALYENNFLLPE